MANESTFQDTTLEVLLAWNTDLNPPAAYLYEVVFPSIDVQAWDVPSEEELLALERTVGIIDDGHQMLPYRRSFSAVSLCIRFLRSLPKTLRKAVRHISQRKPFICAADARSHVLGLVPFCRENQQLRIYRYVELWTNALQGAPKYTDLRYWNPSIVRAMFIANQDAFGEGFPRWILAEAMVAWIEEAKRCFNEGMREIQFNLIFTDTSVNWDSTRFNQYLQIIFEGAIWQTALEKRLQRGDITRPDPTRHFLTQPTRLECFVGSSHRPCYFSDTFPRLR